MWETFNQRHESSDSAFEALCCQLFERWCRRQYGDSIRSFYFVDGRGGDGGVEAFAVLNDGSVVGLQAKTWWDGFHDSQKKQVEKSLQSATTRHPTLIQYVVCCPLDLLPAKGAKITGVSQLDRWQSFETKAQAAYPGVILEYRGKNKIREWLQQPESETINAYWFNKAVIPRDHWHTQFKRVKSAWLDLRYVPDLHVCTVLDKEFSWFVSSPQSSIDLRSKISRLANSLEEKGKLISNLENLPGEHSTQALSDCNILVDAADSALAKLKLLHTAAESQCLPAIEGDFSTGFQLWEVSSRLLQELDGKDRLFFANSPTQSVHTAVKGLGDTLEAVNDLLRTQQRLHRMLIVFGEAGTGKTQTISKICDIASEEGVPILVLPARAYDPINSWSDILAEASNRQGWTADEILDALEASSLLAWRKSPEPRSAPRRAILALDGPDENPVPGKWDERLKELADLCKSRPLIAPIVTTRPESREWLSLGNERFWMVYLSAPDLGDQLPEIFQGYVEKYDITVPSPAAVAWALRTPLAIRTFAEVYRGRTIALGQDLVTTLAELFTLKLKGLDEELSRRNPRWLSSRDLSLRILNRLLPRFLEGNDCPYRYYAECIDSSLLDLGVRISGAAQLFEDPSKAHGILEFRTVSFDMMLPTEVIIRPSFSAIVDYLLANSVATRIEDAVKSRRPDLWLLVNLRRYFPSLERYVSKRAKKMFFPSAIYGRQNSQSLVVSLLLKENIQLLESGLWHSYLDNSLLEKYHARAIGNLRPNQGILHKDWVSGLLRRDMVSCRMVVAELILPSSRIPGAPFGAEFFHQEFSQMSMTERDLVWSGPDWLPQNCDGPWEGNGIPIHDSITLRDDDSGSSVPILAAWVTSTVIHERRRCAIAQIAKWGSKQPTELAKLLINFATVDDVQVVESVAVAVAGAVLELVEHGAADELAKAAHEVFFDHREAKDHPSVVARHAARIVIERAFTIGTDLPGSIRNDATPPYSAVGPRLKTDIEGHGIEEFPLSSDLDWYVAKNVRDPFFKQVRRQSEEQNNRHYSGVPHQVLELVTNGQLKIDPTMLPEITEEIEIRAEKQKFYNYDLRPVLSALPTDKELEVDTSLNATKNEEHPVDERPLKEFLKEFQPRSNSSSWPRFSPEAEAMLAEYARDVSASEPLNPRQLGNGLISGLIKMWGWNKKTFYGDPRGESPGETLGADIAILRQHSQARHGSRSSVAMFGEKYVWSAVNVVSSFLCDRLPGESDRDVGSQMIANQSELGSRMPDPLAGLRPDATPDFRPPWNPAGIAPMPELTEVRQPARGIQWLERADWPDPSDWFTTGEDESILLNGFLALKDHQMGVQIAAWVSCVAVPRKHLPLLERDAKYAPDLWTSCSVHELKGHFGGGVYTPPRLAVWTPWVTDDQPETWNTLSNSGEPVEIPLLPLVTETHWEGTEGETSALSPSKLLRVGGGIIDCHGTDDATQFVDRSRREVAYSQRLSFPDNWDKSNQHLQIQRSTLFQALAEQELFPVWGIRVYRELLPELRPNSWIDQDGYWLVVSEDDGVNFRSVLISQGTQHGGVQEDSDD